LGAVAILGRIGLVWFVWFLYTIIVCGKWLQIFSHNILKESNMKSDVIIEQILTKVKEVLLNRVEELNSELTPANAEIVTKVIMEALSKAGGEGLKAYLLGDEQKKIP
jgi:hypothetical protein